jgi:hypothetical protein
MSHRENADRALLEAEIAELFLAFSEGQLSASQENRLTELLRSSAAAREHYLRLANLQVSLHWRLRMASDEMLAGVEAEHGLPMALRARQSAESTAEGDSLPAMLLHRLPQAIDYRTHPLRFATTALVLTLLLWVGIVTYLWPWFAQRTAPNAPNSPAIVAEIVDEFDAKFPADTPGRFLIAGRQLQLNSGIVVIQYRSGPRVVLQGPADFLVSDAEEGLLRRGKLTARLEAEGQRFAVSTPTAIVRDRGTEFGLQVDELGEAHVHVFQGRVAVSQRVAGREVEGSDRLLVAGESLAVRAGKFVMSSSSSTDFVRSSQLPTSLDQLIAVEGVSYHLPVNPLDFSPSQGVPYPDDGTELTDGRIGSPDPAHRAWVGWNDGDHYLAPDSQTPQPHIEFDLGSSQRISSIEIFYLVYTRLAVHAPSRAVVTLANDSEFTDVVATLASDDFVEREGEQAVHRALVRFPVVEARYARIEFFNVKQWTFLSEIRFLRDPDSPRQVPATAASVSIDPLQENNHE